MPKQIKPSQLHIFCTLKADQITVGWTKPVKTMTFFNGMTLPCHLYFLTNKLSLVIWIKFTWSFSPLLHFRDAVLLVSLNPLVISQRDTKGMGLTHTILSILKYLSNMKPHKCARKKTHPIIFSLCVYHSVTFSLLVVAPKLEFLLWPA